ncbi:bacterial Ig-like domain-containing protein [Listeria welshimeri]|uniref:bacterial Ig-like domain-containing protein n=1 Tax=Listeria welshimeri TaxID=1643 RepID=UPI0035E5ADE6
MFQGMTSLTSLDLSGFNTSKVTDMSAMFQHAQSLTTLDLSNFNTSNVTSMVGMFIDIHNMKSLTLGAKMGLSSEAGLEDLKVTDVYSGEWLHVLSNRTFTSSELMLNYDSSLAGEYIWALKPVLKLQDLILYEGDSWDSKDNFISVTGKDGNPVDFADVTVEGTVDTSKAGTYEVSYSYEGVTSVATITVKAIQTAVNVHDSTLYIGTEWQAEDNFDSAIDKDGNPVDFKDVTVEGTVDTTKAGTYEVKYSYEGVTSVATITVKAIQTAVNVHDSTLYIGTEWQAEDNFDSVVDKDGNSVDFADVTVEGTVDTSKAGTYEVKYSYEGVTSVATITVKTIQTAVNVHDSTLYIGTEWKAEDNFDSAIDNDGNPVDFADVTVEGTVDTSKAGTYEVSYSYEGVTYDGFFW